MTTVKKLRRNTESKMLGGIAAGFADYFDVDVTLVRAVFILAACIPVSLPIVFAYLLLWIIVPSKKADDKFTSLEAQS
jgi:phage shock protein C